jgi:hypothetical protein
MDDAAHAVRRSRNSSGSDFRYPSETGDLARQQAAFALRASVPKDWEPSPLPEN